MKIIAATRTAGTEPVEDHEIKARREELLRRHKRAMKSQPTWPMFGGNIVVDGIKFQVCE